MSFAPHGGFVVTGTENAVTHDGIRESTLQDIIKALAQISPKVGELKEIKAIHIFTPMAKSIK